MSKSTADKVQAKAADDGVKNPAGAGIAGFAALYLVGVPITSWLTRPSGILERVVRGVATSIPGGTVPPDRVIPALSALYLFWTFGASGAISAAGQAMSREEGLDNFTPRQHLHLMRGLPLRLFSAHQQLMDNFPSFALAAALAQALAPRNTQIVNLLGFHVLAKLFVHYPSYLLSIPITRTLAHVLSISAVINVAWRLALGAQ